MLAAIKGVLNRSPEFQSCFVFNRLSRLMFDVATGLFLINLDDSSCSEHIYIT